MQKMRNSSFRIYITISACQHLTNITNMQNIMFNKHISIFYNQFMFIAISIKNFWISKQLINFPKNAENMLTKWSISLPVTIFSITRNTTKTKHQACQTYNRRQCLELYRFMQVRVLARAKNMFWIFHQGV